MTLFRHIPPGQGPWQSSYHGLNLLGVESVPRRGGAGQEPPHTPLSSRAADLRTIQNGFGIRIVNDQDLVPRRGRTRPDEQSTRGSAGAVPNDRRNPDVPAILRQTSIEHIVHRRFSSPPPRPQAEVGNMVVCQINADVNAERVGRSRSPNGRSRSPSGERSRSPSLEGPLREFRSNRAPRGSRRRTLSPRRPVQMDATNLPRSLLRSSSSNPDLRSFCSWGEEHAFTNYTPTSGVFCEYDEEIYEDQVAGNEDSPSRVTTSSGDSPTVRLNVLGGYLADKVSDDGGITPTTALGNSSSYHNLSFSETMRSDSSNILQGQSSASNVMTFARNIDKSFAQIYERRLKVQVKDEQRKALKKVA